MHITGKKGLGRPRMAWSECVEEDFYVFKLKKSSRLELTSPSGRAKLEVSSMK